MLRAAIAQSSRAWARLNKRRLRRPSALISPCPGWPRLRRLARRFRVAQVAERLHGQVIVQFEQQRDAGRDVQLEDFLARDIVEVLVQRAQRVAVGGDQHGLAVLQLGRWRRASTAARDPEWWPAIRCPAARCGPGRRSGGHGSVARIFQLHRRRRDVVRTAPHLTCSSPCLAAVSALSRPAAAAMVALIEAPGLVHRRPVLLQLGQRTLQGGWRA